MIFRDFFEVASARVSRRSAAIAGGHTLAAVI
jgi:hypothetical protein